MLELYRGKRLLQGTLMGPKKAILKEIPYPTESRRIIFNEGPAYDDQLYTRINWHSNGELLSVMICFGDTTLLITKEDLVKKAKEGDLICSFLVEQITRAKLINANDQRPVDGGKIFGYRRVVPQFMGDTMLVGNEEDM